MANSLSQNSQGMYSSDSYVPIISPDVTTGSVQEKTVSQIYLIQHSSCLSSKLRDITTHRDKHGQKQGC